MPQMRILPVTIGRIKNYLVTNLKTGEEASSIFLNMRTAGDSWYGIWPSKEKAVEHFRARVKELQPDILEEQLNTMVQEELVGLQQAGY